MKHLINDPYAFVDEMLDGVVGAHPDQLNLVGPDMRAVVRADAPVLGKTVFTVFPRADQDHPGDDEDSPSQGRRGRNIAQKHPGDQHRHGGNQVWEAPRHGGRYPSQNVTPARYPSAPGTRAR